MSPELITICQQLLKAGKTVSVGMVKARAPKSTPLPDIVQAVKYCKSKAAAVLEMEAPEVVNEPSDQASSDKDLIATMATKIAELEERITVLERKSQSGVDQ